jgi:hypothetical protein
MSRRNPNQQQRQQPQNAQQHPNTQQQYANSQRNQMSYSSIPPMTSPNSGHAQFPPTSMPHQGYNVPYNAPTSPSVYSQPVNRPPGPSSVYSQPQLRPAGAPAMRKKTIKNIQLTPQGNLVIDIPVPEKV